LGTNLLGSVGQYELVAFVTQNLLAKLESKEISKTELFKIAEADFGVVPLLLSGTSSPKATVRYGCASVLMDLCGKHPDKLYPYMDMFVGLLDSKYRILTWNALAAIAHLTAADSVGKFEKIFDRYYGFLGDDYMVTVANTVANSAEIVANKPYLADRISAELLKVQNLQTTPHLTEECRLVIAEKAIETFDTLIRYTKDKSALIAFAKKYQNSSRESLRKVAQRFLKKWQE
jgi:hypothetical protein